MFVLGFRLTANIRGRRGRLASDKHPSLLRIFVNYGRKKFYNIGPWSWFGSTLNGVVRHLDDVAEVGVLDDVDVDTVGGKLDELVGFRVNAKL